MSKRTGSCRISPRRLVIADTIGAANPAAVQSMMQKLVDRYGPDRLGCHFHDTRAMGLANVYAALLAGVRQFDASAGGLGVARLPPGAKGNVATEDVVMLCESMGYHTGLSMPKLLQAVELLADMIGARREGGPTRGFLSSAPDLNRAGQRGHRRSSKYSSVPQ